MLSLTRALFYFKDERENKEHEKLQRKQEIQKILEQEEAALTASKAKKAVDLAPKKVTQAQIQQHATGGATASATGNFINIYLFSFNYFFYFSTVKQKPINDEETAIEENVNRLQIDGNAARNVDEALHVLS